MTPLTPPEFGVPRFPNDLQVRAYHDPDRDLYWVPVSTALLPDLLADWSEPLQVKVIDGQLVLRRPEVAEL